MTGDHRPLTIMYFLFADKHSFDSGTVIRMQAHSKIICAGENAVAFGATAVTAGIDLASNCLSIPWENPFFFIIIGFEKFCFTKRDCVEAYQVANALCAKNAYEKIAAQNRERKLFWVRVMLGKLMQEGLSFPNFYSEIHLPVPLGSGLGGSATVSSLIVRSVARLGGHNFSAQELFECCALGDRIAHGGGGTGTDSVGVVYSGFHAFHKQRGMHAIPVDMPVRFILCHSGEIKNSSASLRTFRALQKSQPALFGDRIIEFDRIASESIQALQTGPDIEWLGFLMNENQVLLRNMAASTTEIDKIVSASLKAGAVGAKVTGGGGGGFVLVLAPDEQIHQVVLSLRAMGKQTFCVETKSSSVAAVLESENDFARGCLTQGKT